MSGLSDLIAVRSQLALAVRAYLRAVVALRPQLLSDVDIRATFLGLDDGTEEGLRVLAASEGFDPRGIRIVGHDHVPTAAAALPDAPRLAFDRYSALVGRRTWFLDRDGVLTGRESAAAAPVTGEEREGHFESVADLCGIVLSPPDSGHEDECAVALAELPDRHLKGIENLIESGHFGQALSLAGVPASCTRDSLRSRAGCASCRLAAGSALRRPTSRPATSSA